MSAISLRTPSFRPVFALPAAAIAATLFAIVVLAWQGISRAVAWESLEFDDGTVVELTQELGPPPPLATKAEQPQAQFQGFQTLSVPDVVGARIAAPREMAFNPSAPGVPLSVPNRESYARIVENEFLEARANPLSTFGIDVDRASYANVRRLIDQGVRPPVDAVRIEELVNYFPYEYAGPTDGRPFAVHTEVAAAPWAPTHRLVRIGIQGQRVAMAGMPPANLVFLVDVSGSMATPDKLPLVQSSLRLLVEQMRAQDRVALVVYAGAAGLVLPPTPGSAKQTILEAIDRLEAGGSTAGGAGLQLAYDVAREHHVDGGIL